MATLVHGRQQDTRQGFLAEYAELLRVLVVGGVPLGMVFGGTLLRLSMLLLRETSPDTLRGTLTDDRFVVGEVTLSGTYQLVALGGLLGLVGAAAYVLVSPWLIGGRWTRAFTVAITAGLVFGALVINPEGVDFRVLEPTWLAVALFVGIPAVFGFALVLSVDAVARAGHWTRRGRLAWALPVAVLALVPLVAVYGGVVVGLGVALLLPARRALLPRVVASPAAMLGFRAVFLAVPVFAAVALSQDLTALF